MSNLKHSQYGKRLRVSHLAESDEERQRRIRPRTNLPFPSMPGMPALPVAGPSLDSRPSTGDSLKHEFAPNIVKEYGDRFVPTRDTGDMRTTYNLMEDFGASPSKAKMIPTESDALKEQANTLFSNVLHTEVAPSSPRRTVSPARAASGRLHAPSTPNGGRQRLFSFNSPSRSNPATPNRQLDMPTDEAYAMSPVRAESRQLLESPRRHLRNVTKTPYRVLDAPELADDFYLNLVDWSSTNVLGVGLGSCVYLWTAHTAAVAKLCDLSDSGDTVSSLSWVQKVRLVGQCAATNNSCSPNFFLTDS